MSEHGEHENLIAFDDAQMDFILDYQEEHGFETVQDAIIHAIDVTRFDGVNP